MLRAALAAAALAFIACGSEADLAESVVAERLFANVAFDRPIEVGSAPDGRVLVAEQTGRVRLFDGDGASDSIIDLAPLIDLERGEGLLSVAFDPAFEANGRLWAYFFARDEPPRTVLAHFDLGAGDPLAREAVVLELPQPGFNQNGGAIRFGPDGYLYLSLGDGSASEDPFENGQNLGTLHGSVIRIDVRETSPAEPYAIPADNPFLATEGASPEIWAYGLRNPFRMAFDQETGELWLGDVGVSTREEIDRVERGANFGWSIVEGDRCLDAGCTTDGLTPPVFAYDQEAGRCAVTGGVVYRGEAIDALRGRYVFGDFCSGEVWALDPAAPETVTLLTTIEGGVVTFGVDADGEILAASYAGTIWRLSPR